MTLLKIILCISEGNSYCEWMNKKPYSPCSAPTPECYNTTLAMNWLVGGQHPVASVQSLFFEWLAQSWLHFPEFLGSGRKPSMLKPWCPWEYVGSVGRESDISWRTFVLHCNKKLALPVELSVSILLQSEHLTAQIEPNCLRNVIWILHYIYISIFC